MGNRYSKKELDQIKSLVEEGLSSRQIAVWLGRSEAGIRNIRYRLSLKRKTKGEIRSLLQQKIRLGYEIDELKQSRVSLSNEVNSLKRNREELITLDDELVKRMIANKLMALKFERPELFYISGNEQAAILVAHILKSFIS